ncbi:A2ML1 protein, partial [Cisticola juncidis]|nr:A2ML1 protein [Cisticola juncidis]
MRSPALPILFTTLLLSARASGAPSYVVVSPAVLYHPHPATLWVHLRDLQGPVQVHVQLQGDSGTPPTTLLRREVLEPHLHLNVTFPAPAPSKGEEEIVALHVSVQGESLNVSESKKVMLRALSPGIFIQTDKAVYKPGQEVKFRVVSLDKDLTPSNQKLPLVFLQDPSGNRIAQWREVTPRQGIVDLSLPLAAEPALGTYKISVEGKSHSFSVEEYVLPKFEVTIHLPSALWEKDKTFPVEICGRYTYGKPVQGRVQAGLCLSQGLWPPGRRRSCTEVTGQTGKNGCFSTEVSMSAFNKTMRKRRKELQVEASLVEEGTGLEMKSTKSCKVLPETVRVSFENPDYVYKPGLPYTGTIRLQRADGSALPERQVLLSVNNQGEKKTQNFLTDSSGRASFLLVTSDWSGRVTLSAEVKRAAAGQEEAGGGLGTHQDTFLAVMPYSSRSGSFLHIRDPEQELPCGRPLLLHVDCILGKEALGSELENLDLVFMVLAKGTITSIFRKEVTAEPGQRVSLSLELPIGVELAPMGRILVYMVLPSGEMVADSTELYVAKCFPNQVTMAFSEGRALPGAALGLRLGAAPGSLCAVRAVDRSVLLLKPEAELSAEAIYRTLPKFNYPYSIQDEPFCGFFWQDSEMETYRLFQVQTAWASPSRSFPSFSQVIPALQLFWTISAFSQGAALKLFTNARTREDCPPRIPMGLPGAVGMMTEPRYFMLSSSNLPESGAVPETPVLFSPGIPVSEGREEPPAPRTYFPETWLWDLIPVGEGGSAEVTVTVPDAITEWEAGMFCTAPQGLGLSPPVTLTAFQPFFVELALPYAVVRHETFTLKATVFNYLRQCLRVQVTLAESAQLEVTPGAGDTYSGCVCADEAKTFQWGVRATSLGEVNITVSTEALSSTEPCGNELPLVPAQGHVDTVTKPLLVQPGGILVEKAHSSLLCQEGAEEVSLEIPADILESSQRAHVTVMGDILGNALQNVDSLLAMPYGCGEQNMVRFAPNIYIQQYLEKTGQLQPGTRAKAQGFLQSGYQRELQYKHDDGSYSAFGKSDSEGNTWLTAFVLKSFGQARAYVAIEERHIEDALRWLRQHQRDSGCFRSVGKLFNNALQGGVSDELSLSAYVTAAMLELGLSTLDPAVSSALRCLEDSPTDNPYTQALLSYVFGLAGLQEQQQAQLQRLAQHSVSTEGQLHGQRKGQAQEPSEPSWAAAAPAEVEMTAYVLLAYLSQPSVSPAHLGTASQIVRWLCKQQNPYGGFASTQVPTPGLPQTAPPGRCTQGSNRLVLQRAALPQLPGTYGLRAHGQGCALVQVGSLSLSVPCPACPLSQLSPALSIPCPSCPLSQLSPALYSGDRAATNMVVIEAKLPSGYSPDKKSVVELKRQNLVKKVEVQPDQVTIYLDQLTKDEEETFSFRAQQDFVVSNLQPATVSLYDYYETGDRVDVAYTAPPSS